MARSIIKQLRFIYSIVKKDGLALGVLNYIRFITTIGDNYITPKKYKNKLYFRKHSTDVQLIKTILYKEEYNIDIQNNDPKVIVDIGANAGYASVFFAETFPDAYIFSFEPEPDNFEILLKNTRNLLKIKVFKKAVWSDNIQLKPREANTDSWSFSLEETEGDHGFQTITMNEILRNNDLDIIDILKIDVEGAELNIFKGTQTNWLSKVKILIIELHDRKIRGCSEALYKSLIENNISFSQKNYGFNTVIYNNKYL